MRSLGTSTSRWICSAQRRYPDDTCYLLRRVVEHVWHDAREAETIARLQDMGLVVEPQTQAARQYVARLFTGVLEEVGARRAARIERQFIEFEFALLGRRERFLDDAAGGEPKKASIILPHDVALRFACVTGFEEIGNWHIESDTEET